MPAQESEWEELIRTGHMTPFGSRIPQKQEKKEPRKFMLCENSGFDKYLTDQAMLADSRKRPISKKKINKKPSGQTIAGKEQKNRSLSSKDKKLQKQMRKLQRTALKAHPKPGPRWRRNRPEPGGGTAMGSRRLTARVQSTSRVMSWWIPRNQRKMMMSSG